MVIPSGIFTQYYQTIDELTEHPEIGKTCVITTIKKVACPNCLPGATTKYKSGGPINFSSGPCPYCNGKNKIDETSYDTVKLRVYYTGKDFKKYGNLEFREGRIMVLGPKIYTSKLIKCDYITVLEKNYKLTADIIHHGFGDKYFLAYFDKI